MLFLATDFGYRGPYVGQMKAVLSGHGWPVVDLIHDLPRFRPLESGHLLAAYTAGLPAGCVVVAVVDPGVGTERDAVVVQADGRWFVGPDNGLLAVVARRAQQVRAWRLNVPAGAHPSFHGRDLFAPAARQLLEVGQVPAWAEISAGSLVGADGPDALPSVIYCDGFGNAITGLPAHQLGPEYCLEVAGRTLGWARTFGEAAQGQAFWYANSSGLAEVAVNCGSAVAELGLTVGDSVRVVQRRDAE